MPRRKHEYTQDEKDLFLKLYVQGVPELEIADQLGVTIHQIKYHLKLIRAGWWGEWYAEQFTKRPNGSNGPVKIRSARLSYQHNPYAGKPRETLDEAIRHADELGVTYGKYIQMIGG